MIWKQLLAASALAACSTAATTRALMIDGCPDGTYPVSVLDDAEVHCLSGRPCSGSYSVAGIPQGVGACPANTGCALLPHNEAIMGCVPAGRGDVAYVNADGSLTRGGKVVSLQQATGASTETTNAANKANSVSTSTTTTTNNNSNNNDNNNGASTTTGTTSGSSTTTATSGPATATSSPAAAATATVAPSNLDGSSTSKAQNPAPAVGSQGAGVSDTTNNASSVGLRGSKAGSGSMDSVPSPTPTPTVTPTATPTPTPTPTSSVENVTAQQTLADIDGDSKTNKGTSSSAGVSITSIIGIVVGCLAVVAVVAGVRLLKKDKEAVVETPEGNLDDYGGGITPKENVVLL